MRLGTAHADTIGRTMAVIERLKALEGPLLPILHALQDDFGCVPEDSVPLIAEALNLSRAEVHGVVTFYHDYRSEPAGRHVIKVCRAEACQSMGGEALAERLLRRLGIGWHETKADGSVTIEPVYCLGLCSCAPAAMVDGRVIGRLDADSVEDIAGEVLA